MKTSPALLTLAALTMFSPSAFATDHDHADDVSERLVRQTSQLSRTVSQLNGANVWSIRQTAEALEKEARDIHRVLHSANPRTNLNQLRDEFATIERLSNRLESQIFELERGFGRPVAYRSAVYHTPGTWGNNLASLKRDVNEMQRTVEHLRSDVRNLASPPVYSQPIYRSPWTGGGAHYAPNRGPGFSLTVR